ncbi:YphA family membrane protein [Oceanobacillus salinisoli]|uniref:YphA family membrane protein n=1 Tax=Oceanobacillus salinisoli TaxID=2678611 RepID=UPI0012E2ABC1|nr:hypothetical protein [Oceanobacillus salinisoli]
MITGILFYWFSWIFWIIVTFLMKKGVLRTLLAYWILFTIIGSSFYFQLGYYTISLSIIILFLGAIVLLSKQPRTLYHLFSAFTISIGYTAMLFWEKLSPIWIIIPRILLISILIGCLTSILSKAYLGRISVCLFGMIAGEMIYSVILSSYGLQEEIGEMLFLDTLFCTLLLLTFLDILHKGKAKLSMYITKLQTKLEVAK